MSQFQPFEIERMMSKYEMEVEFNLSESGVHPMTLKELLSDNPDYINTLLDTEIGYAHASGIPLLRETIAAMYTNAASENVLVTVGAIEANFNTITSLLAPGDEIAIMLPNYMQIWGVAKNHNCKINTFRLREESGWGLDIDELARAVTNKTKLVAICNPNNPTGHILTGKEMAAVVAAADRVGAWILADEVYSGAERSTDTQTPSFYGTYDKVIAIGSMSKAYGLPGLRIGWAIGPVNIIDEIWKRHEYTSLSATMIANKLAAIALSAQVRPRIIKRTRNYIRKGFPVLKEWMDSHENTFSFVPPQAAAIAFVRYNLDINSTEFIYRLIREKSVLIVPGDHFGMDKFFRISYGLPHDLLLKGFNRIHDLIVQIQGR